MPNKSSKSYLPKVALIISALLASQSVFAQKKDPKEFVYRIVDLTCSNFVAEITEDPDYSVILKDDPIKVTSICKCSKEQIASDERLANILSSTSKDVKDKQLMEKIKAYLTIRLIISNSNCLMPELEKRLNATTMD